MKSRLVYADLCKVVAIILVTLGHCAQAISGINFPQFLGGQGVLIPIHMPLFMMVSGFFINPDKIKTTPFLTYLSDRALRLLIPSVVWYIIYCLCTGQGFSFHLCAVFYWFLNCLFVCMMVIWAAVQFCGRLSWAIGISTLLILLLPKTDFLQINFMYPFLWAGYLLRQYIDHKPDQIKVLLIISLVVTIIGYILWDYHYSVYLTPFSTLHFSLHDLVVYYYRLIFGTAASTFIISLIYSARQLYSKPVVVRLSSLGRNTLVIYTGSFVINTLVRMALSHSGLFQQGQWLEPLAFLLAILIICLCSFLAHICRRNHITSLLLLGEKLPKNIVS